MSKYSKRKRQRPIWIQEESNDWEDFYEDPFYEETLDKLRKMYSKDPSFVWVVNYEVMGGPTCHTFNEFIEYWLTGDYEWSGYFEDFDPLDI